MVQMLSTRAGAVQVNCALARLGLAAAFVFVLAVVPRLTSEREGRPQ